MNTFEKLICDHLSFADRLACSQFKKTPFCVQLDELKSAAYMGLVCAAKKYDGKQPFEIYASFRIYGEMKDYLRSLSWGPRGKNVKTEVVDDNSFSFYDDTFEEFFEDVTKSLSALARKIVRLYYVEELTIKEIAVEVDLSSTRIHQIIQASLSQLRQQNGGHDEVCSKTAA